MAGAMAARDRDEIAALVRGLQDAWNAGDSEAFVRPFAEDADFVNIYGMHARGRAAILEGHRHIFQTAYRGSEIAYAVASARLLRDDVAVVHVHARLRLPAGAAGPAAREMEALPSMVVTRERGGWEIQAFHNTVVGQPGR
jgi:uncharacterized protein (TIGR02246 family)